MESHRIRDTKHMLYDPLSTLCSASFPIFEQRTEEQQRAAFMRPEYHLMGYTEGHSFVGFIAYRAFDDYVYIEHLAVSAEVRGKGHGTKLLEAFVHSVSKTVLLEIDPIVDAISEARLRFYERCGFHQNPYPHTHPPYREGYESHPLVVLTSGRRIAEDEYHRFKSDLEAVVMA
ncbi:GNAT family N-acetyltransferase [Porphyromonas cangingivalis]|uniref:GNAT family N-acetyltransferase n=1 Tax=Porphyromonas cangingivalis TaxID=36874 RepID=UPI0024325F32|nr:GNAT family N-acetyltransferase [Porphyromonas cangingivalis]